MPEVKLQLAYVGSAGDVALYEAFAAYRLFRDLFEYHGGRLSVSRTVLDFGCG